MNEYIINVLKNTQNYRGPPLVKNQQTKNNDPYLQTKMSEDEGNVEEKEEEENEEPSVEEEEEVDPRTLLTKEQIQYFRSIFDEFDPQQKERVPAKTIGFVLRFMGFNPTKAQIKNHIDEIDPMHKGIIDFQSFLLPIAQTINNEPQSHEEIIEAFRVLDEENQDYVHTDQLVEFLTTLAEDLEDFELESFLKMADPKGVGKIYYVDFVEKLFGIVRKTGKKDKKEKKK